jgi:hypothetical protein
MNATHLINGFGCHPREACPRESGERGSGPWTFLRGKIWIPAGACPRRL